MRDSDVIVKFGPAIPVNERGPVLLGMERVLRERGISAEVYAETSADDSTLRRSMTAEQRARL